MEESPRNKYTKLGLENEMLPTEDIQPGELNPAAQVPQHTCQQCGQALPQDYVPPQDEPWSSGILDCAKDWKSCRTGFFCPCVIFGKNLERMHGVPWTGPCICHGVCVEGGTAAAIAGIVYFHQLNWIPLALWWLCGLYMSGPRSELQKKYHLTNTPCDPAVVHCLLHWCALCQEHREMQVRLLDDTEMKTMNEAPVIQSMERPPSSPRASSKPGTDL